MRIGQGAVSKMRMLSIMLGVIAIAGQSALRADDLALASGGKPRVTVVLPQSAGEVTRLATADLVRCLGKVLGVEVPTASRLTEVNTPLSILIGDTFGADFGVSTAGLQRDGCAIKTHGASLLITGVSDFGIANGIYTFLIDCAGVRWFAPGELYEVIPSKPDLELPRIDLAKNPDFSYRVYSGVLGEAGAAWLRRSRIDFNTAGLPYYGFGHSLSHIIRPSLYGKDHPEYFPLVNGKRLITDTDDLSGPQPCFTNPDVIRIAANAADEFFKKNPAATTFSLCINDGPQFCQCPNCAALDQPERKSKSGWVIHSDSYFHFVREVAKLVAKTNPGKYLGCYAYWRVELPPRNGEKLPDNVVIALTQDTSQHFDPDYRQADHDLWLAWSKIAARLGKYDYYGLGWLTPRCFPHLAADDIKFIRANQAVGFYCEVYPNWSVTAPQLYMASRLVWDSSLDPDALLDDYFSSLFGPASREMKRFYSILERYWAKPRPGRWFAGLKKIGQELAIADADLIDEAWGNLFKAKTLVIGPEAERIADIEDHFRLSYQIVRGYCLGRQLADTEITSRADVAKAVSDALAALETIATAERVHREKWLTDPLYKHTYYEGPRFENKFRGWEAEVASGVKAGLVRLCDFARTKLPKGEYATVLKDLRDRLSSDPAAQRLKILDSLPESEPVGESAGRKVTK